MTPDASDNANPGSSRYHLLISIKYQIIIVNRLILNEIRLYNGYTFMSC